MGESGDRVEEIIGTLKEVAPGVKINPYPAQSFRKSPDDPLSFTPLDVPALANFIARRREEQRGGDSHMVLRPHYYDMLEAVVETYGDSPQRIAEMLSGEGTWTCFENRYGIYGAGRVVQVGASPYSRNLSESPHAGGYASCFWDDKAITRTDKQVWDMDPVEIADNIDGGMHETSRHVESPCKGCLMPRLNGDEPELELGLDTTIKPAYLQSRRESVGF